jgi:hypothetical protein
VTEPPERVIDKRKPKRELRRVHVHHERQPRFEPCRD